MRSFLIIIVSLYILFIFAFSPLISPVKALSTGVTFEDDDNYWIISNPHFDFYIRKDDLGIRARGTLLGTWMNGFFTYLAVFENNTVSNNTAYGNFTYSYSNFDAYAYFNLTGWLGNATQENTNQKLNISYRFDNSPIIDVKVTLQLWGNYRLAYINIMHGARSDWGCQQDEILQRIDTRYVMFHETAGLILAPTMGKNDFFIRTSNYSRAGKEQFYEVPFGIKMLYFGRPVTFQHTYMASIVSLLNYKFTQDGSITDYIGNETGKYNITDETFYTHYQIFYPVGAGYGENIYKRFDYMLGRITRINKIGAPAPYLSSLCLEVDVDRFSPEKVEYLSNYFTSIGIKPTVSVWFGSPPDGVGQVDNWIGNNSKYLRYNDTYKNATFPFMVNDNIGFAVHSITSGNDTRESYFENITWLVTQTSVTNYKIYIQHGGYEINQENPRYTLWNDTHNIADYLVDNNITYNSLGASIYAESTGLNVEYSGTSAGTAPVIWNGVREWIRSSVSTYSHFISRITTTNLDYLRNANGLAILYSHLFEASHWSGDEFTTDLKNALSLIKSYAKAYSIWVETAEKVIGYYSAVMKSDWEIYYDDSGWLESFQITGGINATYCELSYFENDLINQYGYNIRVAGLFFGTYHTVKMFDDNTYDYILFTQTNILPYYSFVEVNTYTQYFLDESLIFRDIPFFESQPVIFAVLSLFLVFFPAIVINAYIPRFGLIIGLAGISTILMFAGFIAVPFYTVMIVGVVIYLYRGEDW